MKVITSALYFASLVAVATAVDFKGCGCADANDVLQCLQDTFAGNAQSRDLTFIGSDGKSTRGQGSASFQCDNTQCELNVATTHLTDVEGEPARAEMVRCIVGKDLSVLCLAQFSGIPSDGTVRRRRQVDLKDMIPSATGTTYGTCSCQDSKELSCDLQKNAFRGLGLSDEWDLPCTKDKLFVDAITTLGAAAQCQGLYDIRDRAPGLDDAEYVSPYALIENQISKTVQDHLGL